MATDGNHLELKELLEKVREQVLVFRAMELAIIAYGQDIIPKLADIQLKIQMGTALVNKYLEDPSQLDIQQMKNFLAESDTPTYMQARNNPIVLKFFKPDGKINDKIVLNEYTNYREYQKKEPELGKNREAKIKEFRERLLELRAIEYGILSDSRISHAQKHTESSTIILGTEIDNKIVEPKTLYEMVRQIKLMDDFLNKTKPYVEENKELVLQIKNDKPLDAKKLAQLEHKYEVQYYLNQEQRKKLTITKIKDQVKKDKAEKDKAEKDKAEKDKAILLEKDSASKGEEIMAIHQSSPSPSPEREVPKKNSNSKFSFFSICSNFFSRFNLFRPYKRDSSKTVSSTEKEKEKPQKKSSRTLPFD